MTKINFDALPPLSPLAREVLALSLDADDAEAKLTRIANSEPQLAIKLIAIANSAAHAQTALLHAAAPAIRRIGLVRARQLAIALLLGQTLTHHLEPSLREGLWLHALAMAASAQEIARLKKYHDPAAAYLAGLVHDIGFMLEELSSTGCLDRNAQLALQENLPPEQIETRQFGAHHAALAGELLARWGAPNDLVEALTNHHRDDVAPSSLAAIVFGAEKLVRFEEVANLLYHEVPHPFAALSLDRLGVEFLLEQQLELDIDAVSIMAERVVAQVDIFRGGARALSAA